MRITYFVLLIIMSVFFISSCEKELVENFPPEVEVMADTAIVLSGVLKNDTLKISGSASDKDGEVLAYLWSQVSGPSLVNIQSPGSKVTTVNGFVAGAYVFQLMATDNDGATGVKKLNILVKEPQIKELVLRPGPTEAQSCIVAFRDGPDNTYQTKNINQGHNPDLHAGSWTYSSQGLGDGVDRTYFKFNGVSTIPQSAVIVSAKLSLHGIANGQSTAAPQGNSVFPGSPYLSSGSNKAWLKRVIGDWQSNTITWMNKPGTTETNRVEVPESTSQWNYNVIDLDVTDLVKDMVANNQNYGFCFQSQNEQPLRSLSFSSNKSADPNKRPKLVITYK